MNTELYKQIKNENLLKTFFTYSNTKDLSILSQVSKKINNICLNHFDHVWREDCISFYCSNYENNE